MLACFAGRLRFTVERVDIEGDEALHRRYLSRDPGDRGRRPRGRSRAPAPGRDRGRAPGWRSPARASESRGACRRSCAGGPAGIRTQDQPVMSRPLSPLSYGPPSGSVAHVPAGCARRSSVGQLRG